MAEPRLPRRAKQDLANLDPPVQAAVLATLVEIGASPEEMGKELVGALRGLWSARVGNYRVLYTIEGRPTAPLVVIRAIRHRAVAYPGR